jgi:hypothetical protein
MKFDDCSLSVLELIDWSVERIRSLEEENDLMYEALNSIYTQGLVEDEKVKAIVRRGLGSHE